MIVFRFVGKFRRRKTAPSFEKAPSHHKPIFSGPNSLRSSSNSLFEANHQPRIIHHYTPDTPPVRLNLYTKIFIR